ncbi:MAG: AAA-like domain-containing protein [Spirulina sp.]
MMTDLNQPSCSQACKHYVAPQGPLSCDSEFYIERPPLEQSVFTKVTQPGTLLRIKSPLHTGKSSLLARLSDHVSRLDYAHCTIDFQQADTACFDSLDRFLRWFCRIVTFQLGLEPKLDDYWDTEIGSKVSASIYFEHYILRQLSKPFVLSINEVNRLFEYREIAEDFLSLLRFWYEQGQRSPIWKNLRLVLAYSTEIYVPLGMEQSPFNVGEQVWLPGFTLDQVRDLASRYGLDIAPGGKHENTIQDLMRLVGGHPYLTHLAIARLSQVGCSPQLLLQSITNLTGLFGEELLSCAANVKACPDLVQGLRTLLTAPEGLRLPAQVAYSLTSLGIVMEENGRCRFSCELYRRYFEAELGDPATEPLRVVNQLQSENQKLQALAYTDGLTRIPNRRAFDLRLAQVWQQGLLTQTPVTLMLADIDHFKHYNDSHGHLLGDACLQLVARILRRQVRSSLTDFVARYGGEEFAVIFPNISLDIAQQRAEQLRSQIKTITADSELPGVTLSIGLANVQPTATGSPAQLVAAADRVLYESKRLGRDRVTTVSQLKFS